MGRKANAKWRQRRTRLAALVIADKNRGEMLRLIHLFRHHRKFWRVT